MKKWFKECPFCKNEIKNEAVKCQFCKEFIWELKDWWDEEIIEKEEELRIESDNINTSIKWWDITKWLMIWYIIWVIIDFWIVLCGWEISEWTELLINCIFVYWALISQIVWWYKTYKWLQKAKVKWLTFPTWWWRLIFGWICPIACLYMPYQIVRDIIVTYQQRTWKERRKWIVWRWWFFSLVASYVNLMLFKTSDVELWIYLASYAFDIMEYILFIIIISKIQKMEKEYLNQ